MLTDSLHLSCDSCLYSLVSSLLQCRDSSTLQFTRWDSVAELQQHIADCVSGNKVFIPLWWGAIWSICSSYTKYLLTCFLPYVPFCPAVHLYYLQREREKLQSFACLIGELYSEKWKGVASFWDRLTWSCLSRWQKSIKPVTPCAASPLSPWQPKAFDTWVTDGETETDRCWYSVGGDGS